MSTPFLSTLVFAGSAPMLSTYCFVALLTVIILSAFLRTCFPTVASLSHSTWSHKPLSYSMNVLCCVSTTGLPMWLASLAAYSDERYG